MNKDNISDLQKSVEELIAEIIMNNLKLTEWKEYFEKYKTLRDKNFTNLANSLGRALINTSVFLLTEGEESIYNESKKELLNDLNTARKVLG